MKIHALCCVLLGLLGGLWGQWSFGHQMFVFGLGLWVLGPALAMVALAALFSMGRQGARGWITSTFVVLSLAGGALALSWVVGESIHNWQHRRVLAFVAMAHQRLEDEKSRAGTYPASLPSDLKKSLPGWLGHDDAYRSHGDHFTFSFSDPGGMMFSGMIYSSLDKKWHHED